MLQALDESLFPGRAALVRIRVGQGEEENQRQQDNVRNAADEEQRVVGSQPGGGGGDGDAQEEREEHLRNGDKELDAHGRHAGGFIDNLRYRRIDAGIQEGVGNAADNGADIGHLIAAAGSQIEREGKADQIDRIGSAADSDGNPPPQFVGKRSGEGKGD